MPVLHRVGPVGKPLDRLRVERGGVVRHWLALRREAEEPVAARAERDVVQRVAGALRGEARPGVDPLVGVDVDLVPERRRAERVGNHLARALGAGRAEEAERILAVERDRGLDAVVQVEEALRLQEVDEPHARLSVPPRPAEALHAPPPHLRRLLRSVLHFDPRPLDPRLASDAGPM